jgi:hypothetical protein
MINLPEKYNIIKYLSSKNYSILEEDIRFEDNNQVCYYKFPFIVVLDDTGVLVKDVDNNRKYMFEDYKQYNLIINFVDYLLTQYNELIIN